MELSFLVDVNLPKYFQFFNTRDFIHVVDIDSRMSDADIWKYALKNDLVILTKDSDFYYKCILTEISPKIVYFQLGNMTLKELYNYFNSNWDLIITKLSKGSLLRVRRNAIEVIM